MTGHLSVRAVVEAVSGVTGVAPADIIGPRRISRMVRARQIAMFFSCRYCQHLSVAEIGRRMGARDHSTVLYSARKIETEVAEKGMDATMLAVDLVLVPAEKALKVLQIDATEPDPLAVAERAMTEHGAARISIEEIRAMAQFVISAVVGGRLLIDPPDEESPADAGVVKTARRVVMAGRAFAAARYGAGERSATDGLLAAVGDLEAAYAAEIGPIPKPQPSFKTAFNAPRKEANHA